MISQSTIDLIKEFEGYRPAAYRDQAGVVTIGYGTTAAAGVGITPHMGMTISKAEAEWYLEIALVKFAKKIKPKITAPISDNEFGAFLSLAYNIGPGAFGRSSSLRYFNAGDKAKAADNILLWNKVRDPKTKKLAISNGLKNRRVKERAFFLARSSAKPATAHPAAKNGGLWAILVALFRAIFGRNKA